MRIEYRDLCIRDAQGAEDARLLANWWNDGAVMAHAGFPLGLGTTPEQVSREIAFDTDDTRRRLIMEKDGVPIGECSYRNCFDGKAEIGIKICESSRQEKGYGRVLLSMMIGRLFSMGYGKIILDTNLNNLRAQHVYEKLGFVKTAVHIDSWKDQLGRPQSAVDYELLPENFVDFTL
ncbi:MAG: GNAT family N-acetyltransferase [Clostridiales bacterium]|nr:GNAT family N-acetyltransferase [Clostridiales bacterium]